MRPKVQWTPDEDAELRRIYAMSSAGAASAALKAFASRKGIETKHCRNRAYALGLTRAAGGHRVWTDIERDNLRYYAGKIPAWKIARIIGRSVESVTSQLYLMHLSGRVQERGYTRKELAELMGVDLGYTMRRYLERWPLKTNELGNFIDDDVQLWIWDHLDHFELRKFDQTWLKAMLRKAA